MAKITAQNEDTKTCPKCDGTGEVDGKKCPECDGTGEVPKDDNEEAKVKTPVTAKAPPVAAPAPVNPNSERERIAAILNAPEAEGRENLARTLALDTDLTPDAARKVLASAPTAASATPANPLAEHMAKVKNPVVGAVGPDQDTPEAEAARILSLVPKQHRRAG